MKTYITSISAIDPADGVLKEWAGPNVPGISFDDACFFCQNNGLGYCHVLGELVAEIPVVSGDKMTPDFSKMVDYDTAI